MLISKNPEFLTASGGLKGGNNMAAIHLSSAIGGDMFLGFISAVAFATILAVVSGLTLAGASAVSHDLYASAFKKGKVNEKEELFVSKISAVSLGCIAIFLGILFEQQNVAFMVGLAFAVAASANFPILFLSMYWKKLTSRGALIGGSAGLVTAIILVILGPTIWVDVLEYDQPIFPYKYPALFSVTTSFIVTWFFSITDKGKSAEREIAAFDSQFVQAQIGLRKS